MYILHAEYCDLYKTSSYFFLNYIFFHCCEIENQKLVFNLFKIKRLFSHSINHTYSVNTTRVYFGTNCVFICMPHISICTLAILRHVDTKRYEGRYNKL